MVNTLLIVLSGVTLLVWLIQELRARPQALRNLDGYIDAGKALPVDDLQAAAVPGWSDWLLKLIMLLWGLWLVAVILIGGGDFALVLVMFTLLSGVIAGVDRLVFSAGRQAYLQTRRVLDFFSQYTEQQRRHLQAAFGKEMVIAEYARSFFPVLLVVLVLRSFLFEPFQIPSASMVPTLLIGDYILVNKYTYGLRLPVLQTKIVDINDPQRGDVVVFFPPNDNRYFIKRLIGLPGDRISYKNKQLTINGEPINQTLVAELPPLNPVVQVINEKQGEVEHLIHHDRRVYRGDFDVTVDPGHYFMMGDNRDNSSDSRVWGQVPERNIVGKAVAIWMHKPGLLTMPDFSRVGAIE